VQSTARAAQRSGPPAEISSIVSARLARTAGLWNAVQATSGPSSIRRVAAARPASIAQRSQGPRRARPRERPAGPRGRAPPPAIEEVLAKPERVVAEILERPGHVEELGPANLALDL